MTVSRFRAALDGRFAGILTWPAFDALWARLRAAPDGWYVYRCDAPPPAQVADSKEFIGSLDEAETIMRPARARDWCGAVYVDDPAAPGFVKLFDPFGMAACGGGAGTRPVLILCRMAPEPTAAEAKDDAPGWLGRLSRKR